MRRSRKSIPIPSTWELPKYQFGQLVKQGLILSMEYYPQNTPASEEFGVGWAYWCSDDGDANCMSKYMECEIELLSEIDIKTMIQSRAEEIEMLRAQLNLNN